MNWNTLKQPNIGLLFNKSIYLEREIRNTASLSEHILKLKRASLPQTILELNVDKKNPEFSPFYEVLFNQSPADLQAALPESLPVAFKLFTTYPGLLVGSGYNHDTGTIGDFKIGFFFDHTTGQAIIPGSSVKGVLHSFFNEESSFKFILEELHEAEGDKGWAELAQSLSVGDMNTLKDGLFGKMGDEGSVVFYDSVINPVASTASKLYLSDFITPHQRDLLKNPQPLMFLKVAPNVAFDFRFSFKEPVIGYDISPEQLEAIFKQIILSQGLGAKTNIGYGQFSTKAFVSVDESQSQKVEQGTSINEDIVPPSEDQIPLIQTGTSYKGRITSEKKENRLIEIELAGEMFLLKKKVKKFNGTKDPHVGAEVQVVFIENYTNGKEPSFNATIL
jgi:CRISPR type III-B/RAMP module RAMP protein Cmr6